MKIQLINPPLLLNPTALTALSPAPPMGLAYIAAALRKGGHEVLVIDSIGEAPRQFTRAGKLLQLGLKTTQIIEKVDANAAVIGLTSTFSFTWPIVRDLIIELHRVFPDKIIVCGGEHFTALAKYSMENAPIDFVVMGEGDWIVTDLIAAIESGESFTPAEIPGICWRDGDRIVINERAPRIKDIGEISWPAWDLFDLETYDRHNYVTGNRLGKTVPILATRGCPYSCRFCSNKNMWLTRWYPRDPNDIVEEIEHYIKEYGADHFPLQDLTPIIRKEWMVILCKEILRRGLKIKWQVAAGTRCEFVDEEILRLMKESGCDTIYYAPESGSERIRNIIGKQMTIESLMQAIDLTMKSRLNLGIFLVLGFPDDTPQDLRETVRLVRRIAVKGVMDIALAFFFPIPASPLCDELIEEGRVILDDDFLMTPIFVHDVKMSDEYNFCRNMSSRTLTFYKYWIVVNFYVTSWITHPGRFLMLIINVFLNIETSKMGTFLIKTKRKAFQKLVFRKAEHTNLNRMDAAGE